MSVCAANSMRVHGFLRHQGMIAGIGRRLSNEVCHAARISPFATTKQLGAEGAAKVAAAIDHCVAEGLAEADTVAAALRAAEVDEARWPSFEQALTNLQASEMLT